MPTRILPGCVAPDGFGNASRTWPIEAIRRTVGLPNLHAGTFNVDLFERYDFHPDFTLAPDDPGNTAGRQMDFQTCRLVTPDATVNAVIAFIHGSIHGNEWTMEIMAEEHLRNTYDLKETDRVEIEVCEQ